MKRAFVILIFVILVVALILLRLFMTGGDKPAERARSAVAPVPVDGWIVRDTSIAFSFSTIGTLRANEATPVVPELSKKITEVHMKEGSLVRKNDLLFRLDDADILARLEKLEIEEELAAANEARQKALLGRGGISQESYDETLNHLNSIRAEIGILHVELDKTRIRAPFNGKVGLRNVSPGTMVDPSDILTTVQDLSRIKIDFSVPEKFVWGIRNGMDIDFSPEDGSGRYTATIEASEPAINDRTRSMTVRAVTGNPGYRLTPGQSVRVDINASGSCGFRFVPSSALVPSRMGYSVYLYRNGRARQVPVKTGLRDQETVVITEGLEAGDTVITTNILRLRGEAVVRLINMR